MNIHYVSTYETYNNTTVGRTMDPLKSFAGIKNKLYYCTTYLLWHQTITIRYDLSSLDEEIYLNEEYNNISTDSLRTDCF